MPEKIYPGLMVSYRVRPLLGIPVTWLTEMAEVEEGRRFFIRQPAHVRLSSCGEEDVHFDPLWTLAFLHRNEVMLRTESN